MPKEQIILNQNTRKIGEIKHVRTRLETVIPLPAPFTVYIDPCGSCNFKCNFVLATIRLFKRRNGTN